MRLTLEQKESIKQVTAELCGEGATVKLFGSRQDDRQRGGDIDLLVQLPDPVQQPAWLTAQIQSRLMQRLGEQKIDVLLMAPNLPRLPVHEAAQSQGQWL